VGFSTNRCLLVAAVSSASLFRPRLLSAKIAAVALSAVAMRADAEDGFARVATSWTKQNLRHVLDDKPPLRFGDDAEDSLSNRRVIKDPHFLMRGDAGAGCGLSIFLAFCHGNQTLMPSPQPEKADSDVSSNCFRNEQKVCGRDERDSPWTHGLRMHVIWANRQKMVIPTEEQ